MLYLDKKIGKKIKDELLRNWEFRLRMWDWN